ncbi:AraC family transcriptional regulator [Pseudomonas sp. N3-W]|uniref:AraC family transcriptional regulator n=1 Tax=Pseudomonas fungipugnans TaxID=3024217 RepID=A0ABT6QKU4_9PSED|nr:MULTISPECIES: AraC family transcriptional regulator [unclassified Pseudomonas]MDI2591507.1 AraC family transcriptional regulator [Pseudomonas sp. 681]UWF47976.1 AraC family transcriptional regulator [Pseudomonas sp. N3-W]
MTADIEWTGRLWLGRDYGLIHGVPGRTAPHAHYAHQLILAPGRPLTVSLDGVIQTARRLFIPSHVSHAIVEATDAVFTVYVEPQAFDVQALRDALFDTVATPHNLINALHDCPRRALGDPRLERALSTLDSLLTDKVQTRALADEAHLSSSQLQRLFASQLGLPVRRLVLWRRLRRAMALILAGRSVTESAHEAGFADSAHFSRSLKKLFGVTARQGLRHIDLQLLD